LRRYDTFGTGRPNWESKFDVKINGTKIKTCKNENVKFVFPEKSIDLNQTNNRVVFGPFYTQALYFTSESAYNFCDICPFVTIVYRY